MRLCFLLALLCVSASSWAMRVTFIAAGYPQEAYWVDVVTAMQKSASDLGIELQIYYAERDRLQEIELVRQITQRPVQERPDYLIVSGEKRTLIDQLELTEPIGLPVFLLNNTPVPADRLTLGQPRTRFKNWLGALTAQPQTAGYETARALIEAGIQRGQSDSVGQLHMVALSGTYSTGSSILRNQGLEQALAEFPQVVLHQMVQSDWNRYKSHGQMLHLLRRYPQVTLVWCGNDEMAFGAIQAAQEEGLIPGKDILVSGINTSREAMQDVIDGQLTALAGGHYMTGAWALVVLYDYHQGIDFADVEGSEMDRPLFMLFSPEQARAFLEGKGMPPDFRRYSKWLHPELTRYDFNYRQIWESVP